MDNKDNVTTTTDNRDDEPVKQKKNKVDYIAPYMWKKGQSGNPAGRPKGKTMKEYARDLLQCQTEEERQEFLKGLPKEVIWKMAEGNPDTKSDVKVGGELKIDISEHIANKYDFTPKPNRDSEGQDKV